MKQLLITIAAVMLVGCGESVSETTINDTVFRNQIEDVKEWLTDGNDVNSKCIDSGWTPLHVAARYGVKEAAELLIKKGANINITTGKRPSVGKTPLHLAAWAGHFDIVEILIAKGADLNTRGGMVGRTPLADTTTKEIADLLISKGANVNATDFDDKTPLDWADGEIADLLRKHGTKTSEELKTEQK